MATITWPSGLPSPSSMSFTPRERRRNSGVKALFEARTFAREPLVDAQVSWRLNAHQVKLLDNFYKTTLAYGLKRFDCPLPGYGACNDRSTKFLSPITYTPFGNGIWEAQASLEVRYERGSFT